MSAYAHELAGRIAVEVESLEAARHHFEIAIGLDPGRTLIITADLARLEAQRTDPHPQPAAAARLPDLPAPCRSTR